MSTTAFIAVGYDGSPDSCTALSWAATMAALRHESIVATTVVDPHEYPRGVAWPESYWEELDGKARAILAQSPGVEYRLERHAGAKVALLSQAGRDASMLVVGSHGHSVVGEAFLGSVSQSLARHATEPVVVVREPQRADPGRIVVGLDSGEPAERAFEFACRTAELTGDRVVATRAWLPGSIPIDRYGFDPSVTTGALYEQEEALEAAVDEMRGQHPGLDIRADLVEVPPGRALVHASSDAALVVVGSHGPHAIAEALLGSVTHEVLHKSRCPVAVVK